MADKGIDIKVPIKWRMKAWWEGYDIDDIKAKLNRGDEDPFLDDEEDEEDELDGNAPEAMSWSNKRLETAQLIWGEGYCGPGGAEHELDVRAFGNARFACCSGITVNGPYTTLIMMQTFTIESFKHA